VTEQLWRGTFGDEYRLRNADAGKRRGPFWQAFLARHPVASVLEIGCGSGHNLRWFVDGQRTVCGTDVNQGARYDALARGVSAVGSDPATAIRYRDAMVELVLTCGLLIHVAPIAMQLEKAIRELFRVSSCYVLLLEYEADEETVVPYRGQAAALWKRPWRRIVRELVGLEPIEEPRLLTPADGFDDVTMYLYRRGAPP
jgi:SAM-dependent methyltransferase